MASDIVTQNGITYKLEYTTIAGQTIPINYVVLKADTELSGNISINSEIEGLYVLKIEAGAFIDCKNITSVIIPGTVIAVGTEAFKNCSSLETVILRSSNKIEDSTNVFEGCTNLKEINYTEIDAYSDGELWNGIPLVYIEYDDSITEYIDNGCLYTLSEDKTHYSVKSDGTDTIETLTFLKHINNIPVTTIESNSFENKNAIKTIIIPNNIKEIGSEAFKNCVNITNVVLPEKIKLGINIFDGVPLGFRFLNEYEYQVNSVIANSNFFLDEDGLIKELGPDVILESVVEPLAGGTSEIISDDTETTTETVTDGNFTYTFNNEYCTIKASSTSISGVITIPASYNNIPITKIENVGFYNCKNVTAVIFNSPLTDIGENAFLDCTGITYITINNDIATDMYSFSNCTKLATINVGSSVTTLSNFLGIFFPSLTLSTITVASGNSTFSVSNGCLIDNVKDLIVLCTKNATIPTTVSAIGNHAFRNFKGTTISMPANIETIGFGAFADCTTLKTVTGCSGIKVVDGKAFARCTALTSVIIPTTIEYFGEFVFQDCTALPKDSSGVQWENTTNKRVLIKAPTTLASYTIPSSAKIIHSNAFKECASLKSIIIPSNVISIGQTAFYCCTALTSITTNTNIKTIGNSAFFSCSKLTSITIPNSVTTIGNYAFYECSGLKSITIPASVTTIESGTFFKCSGLTSITIPDSVTTIGEYAFASCTALTSITIPNSITSIWGCAFLKCSGLKSITIPDSITTIESGVFSGCSGLKSITIPDSVTSIGSSAFQSCSALTSITIHDNVTTIGNYAFHYCSSLTSVIIGNSVTSIGNEAFRECSVLTSINIPDSVTSIGSYAFYRCAALTSVTIGNGITTIGSHAFYECTALASINIPSRTTSIGSYAFHGCTSLTSVIIPNSVTTIGGNAFYSCSNLKLVSIGNKVTSINSGTFSNCTSLTSVTIGRNVETISYKAFQNCSSLRSFVNKSDILIPTPADGAIFSTCTNLKKVYFTSSTAGYTNGGTWNGIPLKKLTGIFIMSAKVNG